MSKVDILYQLNEIFQILLRNLLDRSLHACNRGLHTGIAQRTLEECHPRLAFRSRSQSGNEAGEKEIQELLVFLFSIFYIPRPNFIRTNTQLLTSRLMTSIGKLQRSILFSTHIVLLRRSISINYCPFFFPHLSLQSRPIISWMSRLLCSYGLYMPGKRANL